MRSTEQNSYYWGVVIEEAFQYYQDNPMDLVKDTVAAIKPQFLTRQFVHEVLKIMFNEGKSTVFKDDTESTGMSKMCAYTDKIRIELFLHQYKRDIPPANQPKMEINYE